MVFGDGMKYIWRAIQKNINWQIAQEVNPIDTNNLLLDRDQSAQPLRKKTLNSASALRGFLLIIPRVFIVAIIFSSQFSLNC